MYASFSTFKTAPGKRDEALKAADQVFAFVKGVKGFKSVVYFADYDNNEYGTLYVWETKEDLEAAYSLLMSKFQELMSSLAIEPPVRRIFEVYEPKT